MTNDVLKSSGKLWYFTALLIMVGVICTVAVSKAAPPIKVGIPSAWDFAGGNDVKLGAEMAIADINAAGGVLGRELRGIFYDNKGDPDESKKVVERLLYQDKVAAIVGFWRSELAIASQPLVMEAKKILVLTGAAAPILTIERVGDNYDVNKYTFSVVPSAKYLAPEMSSIIPLAKEKLGLDKIAFLAESTAFLQPVVNMVREKYGDSIVYFTKFSATTTDFSMEMARAKGSGANNMFVLSSGPAGTASVKQWYDMQLPMLYTGYSVSAQDPSFWDITEGKCDGVTTLLIGGVAGVPITKKSKPFVEAFKKKHGKMPQSGMVALGYDGIGAWAKGVEMAGSVDSDAVLNALESDEFEYVGVAGVLESFDKFHCPYGGGWKEGETWGWCVIQWQKGKMKVIKPASLKTSDLYLPERLKKLMGR